MKKGVVTATMAFGLSTMWAIAADSGTAIPAGAKGEYETVQGEVLKVYSAEDDGAQFRAYAVEWNGMEVIVSDMLAESNKAEGDTITFMVNRIEMPSRTSKDRILNFMVVDESVVIDVQVSPGAASDMQKYLNETRDLVQQGEHEKALQRFMWFHDHALEQEPAMHGVRLSFALNDWKRLGDVYPPARSALVETRDRKEKFVMGGKGDTGLFHDVAALNRTLGEDSKTVSLFEAVVQGQPDRAARYWSAAQDAVITAKRYDLAREYIDPVREFSRVKFVYDQSAKYDDDPRAGANHKARTANRLVEESLKLIDAALALDKASAAREVQAKALALVDDDRLREAVPE